MSLICVLILQIEAGATTTETPRDVSDVRIEDITNTGDSHNDLEESHQDSAIEPVQVYSSYVRNFLHL